jgi:hypothetical protein
LIECRDDTGIPSSGLHQGFETVFRLKHDVLPLNATLDQIFARSAFREALSLKPSWSRATVLALLVTKGAIDRIARHAQPSRGLADVIAGFRIRGQHMRALDLMQVVFQPSVA